MLETWLALGLLVASGTPTVIETEHIPNYSLTQDISILKNVELNSTTSIAEYIEARAIVYGYSPKRAVAIAKAESSLNPNAKNSGSTASGTYQYINGTFKGFCIDKYKLTDTMEDKNDIHVQVECALRMLSEGGESHWSESSASWLKVKT